MLLIMLWSQIPVTFQLIHNGMPHFISRLDFKSHDYSRADWDDLCDHLRDVPWENIFKLAASAAAREFCEWVQVGSDAYISHRKYQVKPHSYPWLPAACVAAIVHKNHFFRLNQREKSSDYKVKFKQASNRCKRVLETAKLAYANKSK